MIFEKDSRIVQSYVLLINKELMQIEEVPNLFNLIEAVKSCLDK